MFINSNFALNKFYDNRNSTRKRTREENIKKSLNQGEIFEQAVEELWIKLIG
jgi:hypothetical protein